MPVFEQGYRRYSGPVHRNSRALAIAWESFRPRLRWWVWLLMFPFVFWPYLVTAALAYMFLMLDLPTARLPAVATTAFQGGVRDGGQLIFASILDKSGVLYWQVLNEAFKWSGPVVVCAVACAGLLASDRRTGALHLYFSRPVSPRDYLAGKVLAVFAFCALLTAVPTLLLWTGLVGMQSSWSYLGATWWVPFSVVGASLLYATWVAGLVLAFSSVLQRPVLIGTVSILTFIFLTGLGNALARSLGDKRWLVLAPHYAIGGITAPAFGLGTPDHLFPVWLAAFAAVGVPLLCFTVIVRRLRAVEAVT